MKKAIRTIMHIKTRREMGQFINDRMNKTYTELSDDQRLEYESSLAKVYLVEAHLSPDTSHDKVLTFLRESISSLEKEYHLKANLQQTDEDYFFGLELSDDKETVTFFVDASDARFWLLHSMDKSKLIDPLLEKYTSANHDIDRAWMPIQLLQQIAGLGTLRGLSLEYDRRKIRDIDFEEPTAPAEYLKMQLWGNKAEKVLRILKSDDAFPNETTLSKVKVKYFANDKIDSDFTIDDIKYDGKITARGTSFQSHITLISDLVRRYSSKILEIEKSYSISYVHDQSKLYVHGSPINVIFTKPIKDLDYFCRAVFSCTQPFKLWGVPIKFTNQLIKVSGFDLHVGRRINFEITPDFMRIFLPAESCGNSVIRIITNLQHYYDSLIDAQNNDGQSILQF